MITGVFEKLVEIRKEKKIDRSDMAGYLGIHRISVANYETGERDVPLKIVEGYAKRFGYELKLMVK